MRRVQDFRKNPARSVLLSLCSPSCCSSNKKTLLQTPQDLWEIVEVIRTGEDEIDRGICCPSIASRLDLPVSSDGSPSQWISRLLQLIQALFTDPDHRILMDPVLKAIRSPDEDIPQPRFHSSRTEYAKVLEKADSSGMLNWSSVQDEETEYRKIADLLTMTSFAVTKHKDRDRLISWPRTQNMFMPDPPHTDLPNPSHFNNLRDSHDLPISAFYFDIANMFHHIKLPSSLAKLFPLTCIAFGDLPRNLQRQLRFKLSFQPKQSTLLRPLQKTLPMGLKWAVYIAHTFAQSCAMESFLSFKKSSVFLQTVHLSIDNDIMNQETGVIHLQSGNVIFLHILDDLVFLCFEWPDREVIHFHRQTEAIFSLNNLPVNRKKSLGLDEVEKSELDFIGWSISLKEGAVKPKFTAIQRVTSQTATAITRSLDLQNTESLLGRLVWISLGLRPLLSVFRCAFQATERLRNDQYLTRILSETTKSEFKRSTILTPLVQVTFRRRTWNCVLAFDASELAGAVVFTYADNVTLRHLETVEAQYKGIGAMADRESEETILQSSSEYTTSHSNLVVDFVHKHSWTTAFQHKWRRKEHIKELEAHSAVLALEWAASFNTSGLRIIILSDSSATIGSLSKGRSSSPRMLLPCLKFGAICMAQDLRVAIMHVPSEHNPAEGPSRMHHSAP